MPTEVPSDHSPPLVSVVMPAYNRAKYIGAAIESVTAQSYSNWRLHIIDDGSTDETAVIVRQQAHDEPRIHYSYQSNAGQSAARNRALESATGKYVCFLDSDNLWMPDKLKQQVQLAEGNPAYDVFYGETTVISDTGEVLQANRVRRWSGKVTEQLLKGNFVNFNTSLVRRSALERSGGFDEALRSGEDFDLWLRLSRHSKFYYTPQTWAKYRVTPGQISADVWKNLNANKAILERFIASNAAVLDKRAIDASWSRFYVRCGRAYASQGKRRAALEEYGRALRHELAATHVWRSIAAVLLRGR